MQTVALYALLFRDYSMGFTYLLFTFTYT